VVPEIAAGRIAAMFEAAGWQTITLKYGRRLQKLFGLESGDALRQRIDEMPNEEYQRLLRAPVEQLRELLPGRGTTGAAIAGLISELDDADLARAFRDLGGHDLKLLLDAFAQADAAVDRPSVVFAYTIKAWRLPTEGHPGNHSALLTEEQWEKLAVELGAVAGDPWAVFPEGSLEWEMCRDAARRLVRPTGAARQAPPVPADFERSHRGRSSTQQAFGRFFLELARSEPDTAAHVVTVSPDVASSTSLGGWINRAGSWYLDDRIDWFADDPDSLIHWRENERGQHIELGIAEGNLVGLLGELGATWSRDGQPLLPIGTLYDPFVGRALEQWSFGIYAGGQSIIVGTPSGITLAPEGGAHQSIITPAIGLAQPGAIAWEPAFSQDLEWTLLHALSLLGRTGGSSSYFRLSTRPIDQMSAAIPTDAAARQRRRQLTVGGGYPLRPCEGRPPVTLVGMGAVMPEVLAAADGLAAADIPADVICLTSADLVFRAVQARQGLAEGDDRILPVLFPKSRSSPIVTVLDGHPHTLAFLAAVDGAPIASLGVQDFGQSGDVGDLYRYFGIDSETIVGAALDLLSP
jgi:pyruvate dehydrogenase E1 component